VTGREELLQTAQRRFEGVPGKSDALREDDDGYGAQPWRRPLHQAKLDPQLAAFAASVTRSSNVPATYSNAAMLAQQAAR
jgi:hypothetical protein